MRNTGDGEQSGKRLSQKRTILFRLRSRRALPPTPAELGRPFSQRHKSTLIHIVNGVVYQKVVRGGRRSGLTNVAGTWFDVRSQKTAR